MKKIIFERKIGTSIYNTGIVSRALSSQTFSEMGFEITPEQFLILDMLVEFGEMHQRQISEIALKDRGNIARIIKILEKKELVIRKEAVQKRKVFKISVTEKGIEMWNKILPAAIKIRDTLISGIPENELDITMKTLKKVYDNARGLVKLQI